jgi:plastocyanin
MTFGAILALTLAACGGGAAPTGTPAAATGTPAAATATPATATATPAAVICDSSGQGSAVTIADFSFDPAQATVATNGFVTFTNNDGTAHTVTFDSGPNCGNVRASGGTETVQFTVAGSYAYHCNIHQEMTGTVEVS